MNAEPVTNISDRTSSQLVFGAAVGAYIGMDAAAASAAIPAYVCLFVFLVLLVSFARWQLRIVADVRAGALGTAWKFVAGSVVDAVVATVLAKLAGLRWEIIVVIFAAWFMTTLLDCLRSGERGMAAA